MNNKISIGDLASDLDLSSPGTKRRVYQHAEFKNMSEIEEHGDSSMLDRPQTDDEGYATFSRPRNNADSYVHAVTGLSASAIK